MTIIQLKIYGAQVPTATLFTDGLIPVLLKRILKMNVKKELSGCIHMHRLIE
jgi:hypothetical protein